MVAQWRFDQVARISISDTKNVRAMMGTYLGTTRVVSFIDANGRTLMTLHTNFDENRPEWDRHLDPIDPTTVENSNTFVRQALRAYERSRGAAPASR